MLARLNTPDYAMVTDGNTVQLGNGVLVSVSSYMNATEVAASNGAFASHLEVLKWELPSNGAH